LRRRSGLTLEGFQEIRQNVVKLLDKMNSSVDNPEACADSTKIKQEKEN